MAEYVPPYRKGFFLDLPRTVNNLFHFECGKCLTCGYKKAPVKMADSDQCVQCARVEASVPVRKISVSAERPRLVAERVVKKPVLAVDPPTNLFSTPPSFTVK